MNKSLVAVLSVLLWATLAIVPQACSNGSEPGEIPANIPDKVSAASEIVRKKWQSDAMLASLLIERSDAQSAFTYDYVFAASSSPKLMHLTEGPSGTKMDEREFRQGVEHVPGTMVMDLPKAIQISRGAGMKGSLVTAELKQWRSDADGALGVPVIIWRLVPDNDPNIADLNDPNMKNYYVDALTGKVYDQERPDTKEMLRGSEAMSGAVSTEMMKFLQRAR